MGDDFKGYVFKITGGNDKDGFPMKQGVFSQGRVRLLLSEGTSCYRAKRRGERKRKSVRGCIVGPDIRVLSVSIVKKGDNEIPGLTDTVLPRRRAPKTASGIRKLYNIPKDENATVLIKKHVVRRTFKSKKNPDAPLRQKAPKIQRLVTEARLRRKKLIKRRRVDAWKKTQASLDEYHKLCHEYFEKQKKQRKDQEKAKAATKEAPKDDKKVTAVTKPAKAVAPNPTTATNTGKTTKPATTKPVTVPTTTTTTVTKTTTTTKNEKVDKKTSKVEEPKPAGT